MSDFSIAASPVRAASRVIRLRRPKPRFQPNARPLDWPASQGINGDRWTPCPVRPDHAAHATTLIDVPAEFLTEPGMPLDPDDLSDLEVDEMLAEEFDHAPLPRELPRDFEEAELAEMGVRHGRIDIYA